MFKNYLRNLSITYNIKLFLLINVCIPVLFRSLNCCTNTKQLSQNMSENRVSRNYNETGPEPYRIRALVLRVSQGSETRFGAPLPAVRFFRPFFRDFFISTPHAQTTTTTALPFSSEFNVMITIRLRALGGCTRRRGRHNFAPPRNPDY